MGYLGSLYGGGINYGNDLYAGYRNIPDGFDIIPAFNLKIQFYSQDGTYIGGIGTDYDNAPYIKLNLKENRIGGLKSFNLQMTKQTVFPLFNQMIVKFYIKGIHWYTGILLSKPQPDIVEETFELDGEGLIKYLDDKKIDVVWDNKTIEEIIEDMLTTYISIDLSSGGYPINYNPEKINPPNINIVKLEANNKSVFKVMEYLLSVANKDYDEQQYTFGVDDNQDFYFEPIDNNVYRGLFEGYQFQDPKIKVNEGKILNRIIIWRNKEGLDESEYVSTVEDAESIGINGLYEDKLMIADYVDQTTAENIAFARIKRFKDATKNIKTNNISPEINKYPVAFYKINNKIDEYRKLINDCEDINIWDISKATITEIYNNESFFISGRRSMFLITHNGSFGEYIEYTLPETEWYPDEIILWLKQDILDDILLLTVFDEDGNRIESGNIRNARRLLEDGSFRIIENGESYRILESGQIGEGLNPLIANEWIQYKLNVSINENIKKIRITFRTNGYHFIYIDRIDIKARAWFQNKLILDEIEYEFDNSSFLANISFGETTETLIDKINNIDESQINTLSIFEKT